MSLTTGGGPLSYRPAGAANFTVDGPAHKLYLEPSPKRVRAELAGETVVDTVGAHMLYETGLLPVYYVPLADVRADLLEPSDTVTHCPFKGDARYWHVRVGDRVSPDGVWAYAHPTSEAPAGLATLCAPAWSAMDRWLEEDVELHVHPRDPYVRVDALSSRRHVVVRAGGRPLADTHDPVALFETGQPTRWYLPAGDVDTGRLARSETTTACPYKGVATYYSIPDLGEAGRDLVWCYADPRPEAEAVRDRLCVAAEADSIELTTEP